MIAESRGLPSRKSAELLAVQALGWLAGNEAALTRFMTLSGVGPDDLRAAAGDPGFLNGVLDFVASDEALLIAFASDSGVRPERVAAARRFLNGHD